MPCVQPEAYGAVANDGLDDRAAIQLAIDSAPDGGCIDLGPGVYHVARRQAAGTVNKASLRIQRSLQLHGAGASSTTLAMLGSGIRLGTTSPGDWDLLAVADGAHDVTVSDLTIDGSLRTGTNEQTHLIELLGPTDHVTLEKLVMTLPVIGPSSGGDCIRLLGSAGKWMTNTIIRDVRAPVCDRSFLGIQRGVDGLVVERVQTTWVGDQSIDFEPTGSMGDDGPIVKNILMRDLDLQRGHDGGVAVAIMGAGSSLADHVRLEDSTIGGGGIQLFDTSNVTLLGLHVSNPGGGTTIGANKRQVHLRIIDSTIDHAAGTTGVAIGMSSQNGANPSDLMLDNVTVTQGSNSVPISLTDLDTFVAINSRFIYTGTPVSSAVHSLGLTRPVNGPMLIGCTVTGSVAAPAVVAGQAKSQPAVIQMGQ